MNKTKKGFTLIEICVVFAILIVAIGIIYPFFISNTKALGETEIRSDLQREGQNAIKCFTDKGMESEKIVGLEDSVGNVILSESDNINLHNSSTSIREIELSTPSTDATTSSSISYCFMLRDNSLYYQQKSSDVLIDQSKYIKIADNIQSIELESIDGKSFSECRGLNTKFILSKDKIKDYTIDSKIYFRNTEND